MAEELKWIDEEEILAGLKDAPEPNKTAKERFKEFFEWSSSKSSLNKKMTNL